MKMFRSCAWILGAMLAVPAFAQTPPGTGRNPDTYNQTDSSKKPDTMKQTEPRSTEPGTMKQERSTTTEQKSTTETDTSKTKKKQTKDQSDLDKTPKQ